MGTILVTGGAGYIGSHTAVELAESGFEVIILDNFCNSRPTVVSTLQSMCSEFAGSIQSVEGDVRDTTLVLKLLTQHNVSAVVHFAGLKSVADSTTHPIDYYEHNVQGLISVLRAMNQTQTARKIVFSSSATVYGEPDQSPIEESAALRPASPYGHSKAMCERILIDLCASDSRWSAAVLRYFNPVGAHVNGRIGENPIGVPNNLMPYLVQVATGQRKLLSVFGNDYPTPDGTGVRDYIHVADLAAGHVSALRYLAENNCGALTLNLGTGHPISVLQLIETFERVNARKIAYQIAPRRSGDVAAYWADPAKAQRVLEWKATRSLEDMCVDAWRFAISTR
jgi:UDP-glucose 4-epimerase